jgi:hypothetical protein
MMELKPCPFCGNEPEIWQHKGKAYAECDNLHCPMFEQDAIILTAWNTRPIEDALQKRIERYDMNPDEKAKHNQSCLDDLKAHDGNYL